MPTEKNTPDFSSYSYSCIDDSVVLPYFKKYWVAPSHRLIPKFLTANSITLISAMMMLINALIVSQWLGQVAIGWLGVISAVCLHCYVLGDHLDGMRAKESNTGSPLGEFLDHYSDIFNLALSLLVSSLLFSVEHGILFALAVFVNLASFIASLAEQKITGTLKFGKLSTLEMIMVLQVAYVLLLVPGYAEFWGEDAVGGIKASDLLVVVSALAPLPVLWAAYRGAQGFPTQLWLFLGSLLLLSLMGGATMSRGLAWSAVTLYAAEFGGRLLLSHVGNLPFPSPSKASLNAIAGYAVAWAGFADATWLVVASWVLVAFLVAQAFDSFFRCFMPMRGFWLWKNPPW